MLQNTSGNKCFSNFSLQTLIFWDFCFNWHKVSCNYFTSCSLHCDIFVACSLLRSLSRNKFNKLWTWRFVFELYWSWLICYTLVIESSVDCSLLQYILLHARSSVNACFSFLVYLQCLNLQKKTFIIIVSWFREYHYGIPWVMPKTTASSLCLLLPRCVLVLLHNTGTVLAAHLPVKLADFQMISVNSLVN